MNYLEDIKKMLADRTMEVQIVDVWQDFKKVYIFKGNKITEKIYVENKIYFTVEENLENLQEEYLQFLQEKIEEKLYY